jgi:hypothetical protein
MSSFTLHKLIQNEPHPELALTAYLRFQNYVKPMIIAEDDARAALLAASALPSSSASLTITRAFAAAKGARP